MKEPERPGERPRPRVRKLATAILNSENRLEKPKGPAEPAAPAARPAGGPFSRIVTKSGGPAGSHTGDCPLHSDVSGWPGAGGPPGGGVSPAGAYRYR